MEREERGREKEEGGRDMVEEKEGALEGRRRNMLLEGRRRSALLRLESTCVTREVGSSALLS